MPESSPSPSSAPHPLLPASLLHFHPHNSVPRRARSIYRTAWSGLKDVKFLAYEIPGWFENLEQIKIHCGNHPKLISKSSKTAERKGPKIILIALLISVNMMFPTMFVLQLIMILDEDSTTALLLQILDEDSGMMSVYLVQCVGKDIEDLEYTPKPEFEGYFKEELLKVWFDHMPEVKPGIYVTDNGDFYDWPFLEKRAAHHGINILLLIHIS